MQVCELVEDRENVITKLTNAAKSIEKEDPVRYQLMIMYIDDLNSKMLKYIEERK